jgi:hypothetical protein
MMMQDLALRRRHRERLRLLLVVEQLLEWQTMMMQDLALRRRRHRERLRRRSSLQVGMTALGEAPMTVSCRRASKLLCSIGRERLKAVLLLLLVVPFRTLDARVEDRGEDEMRSTTTTAAASTGKFNGIEGTKRTGFFTTSVVHVGEGAVRVKCF